MIIFLQNSPQMMIFLQNFPTVGMGSFHQKGPVLHNYLRKDSGKISHKPHRRGTEIREYNYLSQFSVSEYVQK